MLSWKTLLVSSSFLLIPELQQQNYEVVARKNTGLPTRPVSEMDKESSIKALLNFEEQLRSLASDKKHSTSGSSVELELDNASTVPSTATANTNHINIRPRGARGTQVGQQQKTRGLNYYSDDSSSSSNHYSRSSSSKSSKSSKKSKRGSSKGYYGEHDDDGNSHIIGAGFSKFSFSFAAVSVINRSSFFCFCCQASSPSALTLCSPPPHCFFLSFTYRSWKNLHTLIILHAWEVFLPSLVHWRQMNTVKLDVSPVVVQSHLVKISI